jgi:glycosyltransferase involved in cell wall biosynthesis
VQLTALVDRPDHVCCRYRLAAFRSVLEHNGHTLELQTLPRRWWSRLWLLRTLRGASVILQRRLLPAWEIALLRRIVKHLLFDLDDAVFLRDSYSPRGLHHPGRMRRFAATAQASDAVIAGNAFLAEQAQRWTGPDCVHVIPTCIDPTRYCPGTPSAEIRPLQLVWVGSSSTLRGLEAVTPLLEEIGRSVPGVKLKLICDRFFNLRHLSVIEFPWSETGEAEAIAAADVGISWIPDDLWSRGKCGLKVLQYMAAGLPVIANPVGVHPEMIRQGQNGYLAATPREWVDAVRRLAWDVPLRQRMGQLGRYRLEADYSIEAGAARWLTVLDRLQKRNISASRAAIS